MLVGVGARGLAASFERDAGARPSSRAGVVRACEQAGNIGVVEKAGFEPAFVAGVFEEATDEVGHAGNHLADGDVFTDAEAHLGRGVFELIGHAVEHLELDGGLGQVASVHAGEGIGDRACVVRAERELDPAGGRGLRAG